MIKKKEGDLTVHRKAFHDYEILETFEAGIVLVGTEIKSLRDGGGSLQDAYIMISDLGEPWLKHSSIAPYKFGNLFNHEDRRDRKLLLHKREIAKLKKITQEKGLTIIALALYLKKGYVKAKIASARGKKAHDKRAALKDKDQKKQLREGDDY